MTLPVQDPWFEVTRAQPHIYRIFEPRCHRMVRANAYLILGADRDILVDTGMGVAPLRRVVAALSARPPLIFTTHAHLDHVGAHSEFSDCEIWAHPAETEALRRAGQQGLRFSYSPEEVEALRRSGLELSELMIEAVPFAGYDPKTYRRPPIEPTRLVEEGDAVETGDRRFEILHLPGHSPGSIALFERATGCLFAGDAIYDGVIVDTGPGADRTAYRATMQRLRLLPVSVVYGGHNAPMNQGQMQKLVEKYLSAG